MKSQKCAAHFSQIAKLRRNIDIGQLAVNDSCQLGLFCIWFTNVSVNMNVGLHLHTLM